jgi:hypothetical protein
MRLTAVSKILMFFRALNLEATASCTIKKPSRKESSKLVNTFTLSSASTSSTYSIVVWN